MNKFRQLCLLLCCSFLLLSGFSPVVSKAYNDELVSSLNRITFNADETELYSSSDISYNDELGYYTIPSVAFDRVYTITLEFTRSDFVPLHDVYDYYLILTAYSDVSVENFTFAAQGGALSIQNCDGYEYDFLEDYQYFHHDGYGYTGFTMLGKITDLNSTSISYIDIHDYNYGSVPNGHMHFKYQIVCVDKVNSGDISAIISDKLDTINDNITNQGLSISEAVNSNLNELQRTIEDQYTVSDDENFGVDEIIEKLDEKAGALTFASDVLIDFLDLFNPNNEMDATITFPSFTINVQGVNYEVWKDYEYNLTDLEENFSILLEAVRWGTTMLVYVALISYIGKCWDAILGG